MTKRHTPQPRPGSGSIAPLLLLMVLIGLGLGVAFSPVPTYSAPLSSFTLSDVDSSELSGRIYIVGTVMVYVPDEYMVPRPEVLLGKKTSIGIWQDTVSKSPFKPRPRMNLARAYQESGMFDLALQEYNNALLTAQLPRTPVHVRRSTRQLAAMNISQIHIGFGNYQQAESVLVTVWNEEPGFPGIAANLAIVVMNQVQTDPDPDPIARIQRLVFALELLDVGIAHTPDYPWFTYTSRLYFNRALIKQSMGKCEWAESDFKLAQSMDADIPPAPECRPIIETLN